MILALQGYILGFFPKFRQRKSCMRLGQRTRMLLSRWRPQGGACCGLSSLRLSSEFPGSWQPPSNSCRFLLRLRAPVPDSTPPLLPAHQGLGSCHFPCNPEGDQLGQRQDVLLRRGSTLPERFNSQLTASRRRLLTCSSQPPFPHHSPSTRAFPASLPLPHSPLPDSSLPPYMLTLTILIPSDTAEGGATAGKGEMHV